MISRKKVDCWEIMELREKQEKNDYIVDWHSLTVSIRGPTKAKRVILYPTASTMKNTRWQLQKQFFISLYNMSWISSIGEITQKKNFTNFYFLNRCIEKNIPNHFNFNVCVKFGHCFCLFGVFRPPRECFTHIETSPLPVKGFKF